MVSEQKKQGYLQPDPGTAKFSPLSSLENAWDAADFSPPVVISNPAKLSYLQIYFNGAKVIPVHIFPVTLQGGNPG